MAREKGMSSRRFYVELAKRSPVKMTAVDVLEFLRAMSDIIAKHVAPQNVIRVPQLATFRIRYNNATPERTKRIGGNEVVVAAKPVTAVLKATAAHELRKAVRTRVAEDDGKKKEKKKKILRAVKPVAHEEASETQRDSSDDLD